MDGQAFVETTDPGEAFSAIADDTRVDILRALQEMDGSRATFSDLREAVGIRDSGQFNYHLHKLTDRFVRKVDDEYRLTLAGTRVHGAVLSGAFTMTGELEPVDLPDPCPSCGGSRTLSYEYDSVHIECGDCDLEAGAGIPPGVFAGRDQLSIPEVADDYFRALVRQYRAGFCRSCEGPVDPTVEPIGSLGESPPPDELESFPVVRFTCRRCGDVLSTDLGIAVLDHPEVIGFFYDRGVDVREESFWDLVVWDPDRAWIESRDSFRAAVEHTVDGDAITVFVDESLDVVRTETDADRE